MDLSRLTTLNPGGAQQAAADSHIQRFYDKLDEIFSHWIPLEDVYYRSTEFGELELSKFTEVQKWPEFDFFHMAIAKNGGPIAFMIQDKVLFIGQKEIKSMVFVMSGYGKRINLINLSDKLNTPKDKLRWAFLQFTPEEDLLLISADGTMYLLDPLTGDDREKPINLGPEFAQRGIVDAKMFDNQIVFRNTQNQFYYIQNYQNPIPTKFEFVTALQQADKVDYLLIPKGPRGNGTPDLIVTDPFDGVWVISENKPGYQVRNIKPEPFGAVKYMALNAKKELLSFYTQADVQGRIIVLKPDLSAEFNRLDTLLTDAKGLEWCGNNAPVLVYPDKIVIVGPNESETIDLNCQIQGIKCMTEIDGLRVITSEKTYFLEIVQAKMLSTFKIASVTPSAKLLKAQKSVDLNQPKADDIINELGKNLIAGIDDLLETATCEHSNIPVMKHLLRTASFAKTFPEASGYDSNKYVEITKTLIVLTKLRNSPNCARAITYKQFEKFKAKNILKQMLKFRDYKLALLMIEQLNLKQYISLVYDDWCQTMIKYSKCSEQELEIKLQDKFDQLKIKIAEEQGFDISSLQYNVGPNNLTQQQQQMILSGKVDSSAMSKMLSAQLPPSIKINIDFTKLAKIADSMKKKNLASFLIKQERSIVKKIPFLLEAQQFDEALKFAIEGGDPNIINKVFSEILSKYNNNLRVAIDTARNIPDGLRHLRNFAKARQNFDALKELNYIIISNQKSAGQDFSFGLVHMRTAYETSNLESRNDFLRQTIKQMSLEGKDDFFAKMIEEMIDVQDRQRGLFKQTKDRTVVDCSLNNLYQKLAGMNKEGEQQMRDIYKNLKVPEKYHIMLAIRGAAKQGQWDVVTDYVKMKKPPVTYSFLAEICTEGGKIPLAVEAIKKISDYDEKIPMLMDIAQWRDAIEESFTGKRLEFLDEIRAKGPAFVEDFIKEEQTKRQK